ncbi:cell wall-active antibiotics response protein LiaF [Anaerobacillus sp. MEB173]|uniref:cell wall-active antibiotics response protein LiaF n=1 Tax=Anaerobacillus sp. MEB173 TaxID=3383345 RepID=UPI003F915EC4
MRTSSNYIIGIFVIFIGVIILLNTLNINIGNFIGPLIFLFLGVFFYQKKRRILSTIFFAIGLIAFFESVLRINIGGVIVAAVFVYFGYRLIRRKKKDLDFDDDFKDVEKYSYKTSPEEKDRDEKVTDPRKEIEIEYESKKSVGTPQIKSSLIGDLNLMGNRYELNDMNIWHGIGDVKIDLSKAIISQGETVLVVNGWIGDIDIYIPYDLDVSVNATVTIGDLEVLNYKQGGLNRNITLSTKEYKQSSRRVKIILSLFIGDIDVRYV